MIFDTEKSVQLLWLGHISHRNFIKKITDRYANMPMLYTVIFHGCKNNNFQMKNCDAFLIFAQNIDCGYTLEPPQ